nr:DNA-processing protein DprA [Nocardia carnea]
MSTTPAPPAAPDPQRQLAWAIAARAAIIDPVTVHELLATRDVEEAAAELVSGSVGDFPSALRDQANGDLDRAHRSGARLLTPEDEQWPHELDALDTPGTGTVSPVALWIRGAGRLDLFGQYRIAVIGARAATDYGVRVAADFAGLSPPPDGPWCLVVRSESIPPRTVPRWCARRPRSRSWPPAWTAPTPPPTPDYSTGSASTACSSPNTRPDPLWPKHSFCNGTGSSPPCHRQW